MKFNNAQPALDASVPRTMATLGFIFCRRDRWPEKQPGFSAIIKEYNGKM